MYVGVIVKVPFKMIVVSSSDQIKIDLLIVS